MERVEAKEVHVRRIEEEGGKEVETEKDIYHLSKFIRSNSSTCYNHKPIIAEGDIVSKGEILADGPSMNNGEMALGRNVVVGFMTWDGYNYEDAVIMSERLVKEDVYTSIHIEEYESESRDTKLGPEELHVIFQTFLTMPLRSWMTAVLSISEQKSKTVIFLWVK